MFNDVRPMLPPTVKFRTCLLPGILGGVETFRGFKSCNSSLDQMSWILNDIKSLIPSSAPELSPTPTVGSRAPSEPLKLPGSRSVITMNRHLGCPFCEKTLREMIEIANKEQDIQFRAVFHATEENIAAYRKELDLHLPNNLTTIADPDREIYAAWGVGELGEPMLVHSNIARLIQSKSGLVAIFGGDVMSKVGELRKQGISESSMHLHIDCI